MRNIKSEATGLKRTRGRPRVLHVDGKKYCNHCGFYKPLSNYGNDKNNWDNLRTKCKECRSSCDKEKETKAKWLRENKGYQRAVNGINQAIYRGASLPDMSTQELALITQPIYEEMQRLTKETGIPHHVDHHIPCCEGGLHHPSNLQVITARANHQKNSRTNDELLAAYTAGNLDLWEEMGDDVVELIEAYNEAKEIEHESY